MPFIITIQMIKPSAEAQKKNLKIIKLSVGKILSIAYNNKCRQDININ